jgi:gas vesicle structural protein
MSDIERSTEPLQPHHGRDGTLQALIETLLDRGLVINADITVSVGGVELLGIRIRAALASFDTAARYGLDFPGGTNRETKAWGEALELKESCPQCGKVSLRQQLLDESCPWCGWRSARSIEAERRSGSEDGADASDGDEDADSGDEGIDSGDEYEEEPEDAPGAQDRPAPEPARRD